MSECVVRKESRDQKRIEQQQIFSADGVLFSFSCRSVQRSPAFSSSFLDSSSLLFAFVHFYPFYTYTTAYTTSEDVGIPFIFYKDQREMLREELNL